jgi:hypothetical protein
MLETRKWKIETANQKMENRNWKTGQRPAKVLNATIQSNEAKGSEKLCGPNLTRSAGL